MIYLNVDESGYLLSVSKICGGIETNIDLTAYDLTGDRIRAHKWENETLLFDTDRYAEIEAENEAKKAESEQPTETEQLRADVDYIAVMTGIEL